MAENARKRSKETVTPWILKEVNEKLFLSIVKSPDSTLLRLFEASVFIAGVCDTPSRWGTTLNRASRRSLLPAVQQDRHRSIVDQVDLHLGLKLPGFD